MAIEIDNPHQLKVITAHGYKDNIEDAEHIEVYPSLEDVPIQRSDIAPVNFDGMPRYNFVKLLVEANKKQTDAYPEYSMQTGFAMLSAVTRRRAHFNLNGSTKYLNVWAILLGLSSSRKSGPMSIGEKIVREAVGETFLPSQCTPETLQKILACRHGERTKTGEVVITELDKFGEIPHGQRVYWKDEAGSLYSQLGKQHMKGTVDIFNELYECKEKMPDYTLSNDTYELENLYFAMIAATTTSDFCKHMTSGDANTGFLPRHIIVNPTYQRTRGPIRITSGEDSLRTKALIHSLKIINVLFGENDIELGVEEGVLSLNGDENAGFLNKWSAERKLFFSSRRHELDSFFGKYQTTALKLVALIDIGNLPYILSTMDSLDDVSEINMKVNPSEIPSDEEIYRKIMAVDLEKVAKLRIERLTVTLASFIYAARLFDNVYLPYASSIMSDIGSANGVQPSIGDKVYDEMRKNLKIERSKLMRKIKCGSHDLNIVVESMEEAGSLKTVRILGKTKPTAVYVYIQNDNEQFTKIPYSGNDMDIKEFRTIAKFKKATMFH
ncbi:MAG TPA: hypothetical protein VGK06_10605 [Methanosarcina sp.]